MISAEDDVVVKKPGLVSSKRESPFAGRRSISRVHAVSVEGRSGLQTTD